MTVLVDTSAFFALLDLDSDDRAPAAVALQRFQADEESLVTHEYVVVETITLVQRRLGMGALRRFVDDLLPVVDGEWVDPALHAAAREAMLAAGQRGVSLVDWTSFLVMRRRGIATAFAFDDDFAAQGFDRLIDRTGDRYRERVVDPSSGEAVRDVVEPLSRHRGHGSAKRARENGQKAGSRSAGATTNTRIS